MERELFERMNVKNTQNVKSHFIMQLFVIHDSHVLFYLRNKWKIV